MKNFNLFTATASATPTTLSATAKVTMRFEPVHIKESAITYTQLFISDVLDKETTQEDENRRQNWYCALTEDNFSPTIKNDKIVLFLQQESVPQYQLAIEKIQIKILESIEKNFKSLTESERSSKEQKLTASLSEICRYIPDLDRPDASFFIDKKTCGIGVTIKKSGTLSLLIYDEGKVEYSLASNAKHGGLFRMTGTAKTTKDKKNSEYIKVLLGLIESK